MVDYSKKTVAELTEILKSRSLPHSGKKADLVARLNEADKEAQENEADKAPPAESTSASPAQGPEPVEPASKPVPEKTASAEPTAEAAELTDSNEAQDSPSANTDTALANSASYSLNLPQSEVDSELAKRKARAERFGTSATAANGEEETSTADAEAERALERAKRFGTGQTAVGKLDEALPEERERGSRKRNRTEETSALDDPALRKGFSGRGGRGRGGRFRGRGGRDNSRRRTDKPTGVSKGSGVFSSESDRAAAEARKKKFASAS